MWQFEINPRWRRWVPCVLLLLGYYLYYDKNLKCQVPVCSSLSNKDRNCFTAFSRKWNIQQCFPISAIYMNCSDLTIGYSSLTLLVMLKNFKSVFLFIFYNCCQLLKYFSKLNVFSIWIIRVFVSYMQHEVVMPNVAYMLQAVKCRKIEILR